MSKYDIVFHLVGKQRIPNLMGVLHIPAKKHVFIETKEYNSDYIYNFLDDNECDNIVVQANDIVDVRDSILKYLNNYKADNIAFNLTGGTKLMFIGAYVACNKLNATPFYIDATKRMLFQLDNNTKRPLDALLKVNDFLKLHVANSNYTIKQRDIEVSNKEKQILNLMWKNRNDIKNIFSKYMQNKSVIFNRPFFSGAISITILDDSICLINIDGISCKFYRDEGYYKFLSGTWFEEYIYTLIEKYVKEGTITDIALGTIVEYNNVPFNEFDILFTDGKRLFEIECKFKTGGICQTDITKLDSNAKYFGGSEVCSILASTQDVKDKGFKEKIKSLGVNHIYGDKLSDMLDKIITDKLAVY